MCTFVCMQVYVDIYVHMCSVKPMCMHVCLSLMLLLTADPLTPISVAG